MNDFVKNALIEINSLDNNKIVKTAGVLHKIKEWLHNPKYRQNIDVLKSKSPQIDLYLKNLDKYIKQIDIAIENNDAEKYNQVLEEIKVNASLLNNELEKLAPKKPIIESPKSDLSEGIINKGNVLGGGNLIYTQKFAQSVKLQNMFISFITSAGFSKEEADAAVKDKSFWEELTHAVGLGTVLGVSFRDKDSNENLNGDYLYLVFSNEFKIPNLQLSLQVLAEVVDKTYNKVSPSPIKIMKWIKRIHPIRIKTAQNTPWYLSVDKIKEQKTKYNESNYVPPQKTPITKEEFKEAIKKAWPQAIPDIQISEVGVDILYAQAALETGNFRLMNNYNFGNIKASPKSGKWTSFPCGENLGGKKYKFTAKHPMCYFRAFDTAEEGIVFYLKTLSGKFKQALESAVSGNVEDFAYKLNEQGYYTADPKSYLKGLKDIMGKGEESVANINDEIQELAQALGVSLSSNNLTQMVVNAIGEELLPTNNVYIKIKAANVPSMVEYAYVLSNAISRTIDADTDVCINNNDVEINCNTFGGINNIKEAVQAIDKFASKMFSKKYKQPIISIIREGKSIYNIASESKIDSERRKFALMEIINVK